MVELGAKGWGRVRKTKLVSPYSASFATEISYDPGWRDPVCSVCSCRRGPFSALKWLGSILVELKSVFTLVFHEETKPNDIFSFVSTCQQWPQDEFCFVTTLRGRREKLLSLLKSRNCILVDMRGRTFLINIWEDETWNTLVLIKKIIQLLLNNNVHNYKQSGS